MIKAAVMDAIEMQKNFPELIAGFDLVRGTTTDEILINYSCRCTIIIHLHVFKPKDMTI